MPEQNDQAVAERNRHVRDMLATKRLGPTSRPLLRRPNLRIFVPSDVQRVHLHRRNLPHWELEGSTYFVTCRVDRPLGAPLVGGTEPQSSPADVMEAILWFHAGSRYELDAYVIMPDHLHMVLKPLSEWSLSELMRQIKGFSGQQVNRLLHRRGRFWQQESFDRVVRSEADWLEKVSYIHENPVRSGLVSRASDYPWSSLATIHQDGWNARGTAGYLI